MNAKAQPEDSLNRWPKNGGHVRGVSDIQTRKVYDGANNVVALSVPFAHASAYCQASPQLCKWLGYDRANRLYQLDAFPNGTSSDATNQRTCLEYDEQGNLRRLTSGCSSNSGATVCPTGSGNTGTSTCNPGIVDYEVDDFGNVVTVTVPWTYSTSARAPTRYVYDALGNVTKKISTEMANTGANVESIYDMLGRLKKVVRNKSGYSSATLFELFYDSSVTESGCPSLAFVGGRLSSRSDSFGMTWYSYDAAGHVLKEVRRRIGLAAGCGNGTPAQDKNPSTSYEYNSNGDLFSIVYPHGRTVTYGYPGSGAMHRVSSISSTFYSGGWSALPGTPIAESISWEPYGRLRAYRLSQMNRWVEYGLGTNLGTKPTQTTCGTLDGTLGAPDGTGRYRGVYVSDGGVSLGNPSGEVFKQLYTWDADQIVAQQTCYLNESSPQEEAYGYDKTTRLVATSMPMDGGAAGANFLTSSIGYDLRNNRSARSFAGSNVCQESTNWWTAALWQVDMPYGTMWGSPYGTSCNGAVGKYNNWYDRDGRRTAFWDETTKYQVQTSYLQPGSAMGPGIETVYASASILRGGSVVGTYGYFYDAFQRRRAKTTPWSTTDEYFYDTGHQMLEDLGNGGTNGISFPSYHLDDDYVWLDGRPVFIVRGRYDYNGTRASDGPGSNNNWCYRDGEQGLCGTFAVITDHIGKPVLMLDRGGIAGTSFYQAFGHSNRQEWRYASPHTQDGGVVNVTTIRPPMPPSFDGPLRILLNRNNFSSASTLKLAGVTQTWLVGDGAHMWSTPEYATGNTWKVDWTGAAGDYGFDLEAFELHAKQKWVWWAWTPLRFPGQYYDPETELHENWNRYYDPGLGRYTSPEPMLGSPEYVRRSTMRGMSVPTYAYAANNPLLYIDPTGLDSLPRGPLAPNGICPADRPVPFLVVPASAPGRDDHTLCIRESEARELKTLCEKLSFCLDYANDMRSIDPAYSEELKNACEKTYICRRVSCDPPAPESGPFTGNSSPNWSTP